MSIPILQSAHIKDNRVLLLRYVSFRFFIKSLRIDCTIIIQEELFVVLLLS